MSGNGIKTQSNHDIPLNQMQYAYGKISIIALDLLIKITTKIQIEQNCMERQFIRLNSHTKYQLKGNVKKKEMFWSGHTLYKEKIKKQ